MIHQQNCTTFTFYFLYLLFWWNDMWYIQSNPLCRSIFFRHSTHTKTETKVPDEITITTFKLIGSRFSKHQFHFFFFSFFYSLKCKHSNDHFVSQFIKIISVFSVFFCRFSLFLRFFVIDFVNFYYYILFFDKFTMIIIM